MNEEKIQIGLRGVGLLDYREMTKDLDPKLIAFKPIEPGAEHGELATGLIIVTLASEAILALALYLLRKHKKEVFDLTLEKIRANGNTEKITVHFNTSESQSPEAEIVKQLTEGLRLDINSLKQN